MAARAIFDVRDFQAIGDGRTDDLPAFLAAMAAMGSLGPGRDGSGMLLVPAGTYFLGGDLEITRPLHLMGTSPGSSVLRFAPYKGIVGYPRTAAPDGGDATYARIENLRIMCSAPDPYPGEWQPGHDYRAGDRILPSTSSYIYHYECIQAGRSHGTQEPRWGDNHAIDLSTPWAPGTYHHGKVARASGHHDVFFMVTTPTYGAGSASTGAVEPQWNFKPGQTTRDGALTWTCFPSKSYIVQDGTVLWACRVAAGVRMHVRMFLHAVQVEDAINAGFHVQADAIAVPPTNANGWSMINCQAHRCNVGIATRGGDANAGAAFNIDISGRLKSHAERGVADDAFLGNHWFMVQVAACRGPWWHVLSGASTGSMHSCYSEGDCGPALIRSAGYTVFGGTHGAPFSGESAGFRSIRPDGCSGLMEKIESHSPGVQLQLALAGWMKSSDDYTHHAMQYGSLQPGWWCLAHANTSGRASHAISGSVAREGYGLFWFPRGHLEGRGADQRYIFPDEASLISRDIRGGARMAGDRVRLAADAVPNGFAERVVIAGGFEGLPWAPGISVESAMAPPGRRFATMVRPDNGFVYQCTRSGRTHSAEPGWPTRTAPLTMRWAPEAIIQYGEYVIPIRRNGRIYMCSGFFGPNNTSGSTGAEEPVWPMEYGARVRDNQVEWMAARDDAGTFVEDNEAEWTCVGQPPTYAPINPIRLHRQLVKDVSGTTIVTLTPEEAAHRFIVFTGTLSADATVIFPMQDSLDWFVHNRTSGAFGLKVRTAAQDGLVIPQGSRVLLWGDSAELGLVDHPQNR